MICLVVGYAVAYYAARYAGKYRVLVLILLISPFWISYLMRIYAWQSLLAARWLRERHPHGPQHRR